MTAADLLACIDRTLADTKPDAGWPDYEWPAALGRARGTLETCRAFARKLADQERVRGAVGDFLGRSRR